MKRLLFIIFTLALTNITSSWALMTPQDQEIQSTYKDIKETFGIIPTFMKNYPSEGITGAWMEMKGVQLNPQSAIPGKYKELIGLAIAAQIPCRFCSIFHTEAAKINAATNQELAESIAMAAHARRWSTFLNGAQIGQGEFRTEVDKALMYQNKHKNLQAMEVEPSPKELAINTPEDVYKDVRTIMGFVPNYITQYPKNAVVGAWKDMKGVELNPDTAVPGKYKELIGLAVSAQIPCYYCIYYHTQAAIMQGANKQEILEAVTLAGTVRFWSTVLNGQVTDEKSFRKEVASIMGHLKKKMSSKDVTLVDKNPKKEVIP